MFSFRLETNQSATRQNRGTAMFFSGPTSCTNEEKERCYIDARTSTVQWLAFEIRTKMLATNDQLMGNLQSLRKVRQKYDNQWTSIDAPFPSSIPSLKRPSFSPFDEVSLLCSPARRPYTHDWVWYYLDNLTFGRHLKQQQAGGVLRRISFPSIAGQAFAIPPT